MKRLLRFRIRTLLILVAIASVALGVWSIHVKPYRDQAIAQAYVAQMAGTTAFEAADGPAWNERLVVATVGPEAYVKVTAVDLGGSSIDDAGVARLAALRHLRRLNLDRTNITDRSLQTVGRFNNLQTLSLRYCPIGDAGVIHLQPLQRLETAYLTGTTVSGTSGSVLQAMRSLRHLYLRWTRFSGDEVQRLRQAIPGCAIHHHSAPPQSTAVGVQSPAG